MSLLIIDTNVVLSAMLGFQFQSYSARVLIAILSRSLPALTSPNVVAEYSDVLLRPAVMRRHGRTVSQINRLLADIVQVSRVTDPPRARESAPDPGDQHLWDLLAAVPDAILVTGDRKLLDSSDFPGRIISPRECVDRFGR